jgi:hypothetical protein
MTATILHAKLQRSRFSHLALEALTHWFPVVARLSLQAVRPAPALTAAEMASIEAQKVRAMAYTYSKTDPGFAADLYAAAARHEGQHEA